MGYSELNDRINEYALMDILDNTKDSVTMRFLINLINKKMKEIDSICNFNKFGDNFKERVKNYNANFSILFNKLFKNYEFLGVDFICNDNTVKITFNFVIKNKKNDVYEFSLYKNRSDSDMYVKQKINDVEVNNQLNNKEVDMLLEDYADLLFHACELEELYDKYKKFTTILNIDSRSYFKSLFCADIDTYTDIFKASIKVANGSYEVLSSINLIDFDDEILNRKYVSVNPNSSIIFNVKSLSDRVNDMIKQDSLRMDEKIAFDVNNLSDFYQHLVKEEVEELRIENEANKLVKEMLNESNSNK